MTQRSRGSLTSNIVFIAIAAMVLLVLYFVVKGIFIFLYKFAVIFLIIALIANYKVPLNYLKSVGELIRRQPVTGIGAVLLSAALYPIVFLILMFRAIGSRTMGTNQDRGDDILQQMQRSRRNEEYVEYEEIIEDDMELKEIERRKN